MSGIRTVPTLYEWIGGGEALEEIFTRFYEKVLHDEILEPLFRHMSKDHQEHVAHFVGEVFGGPKLYTENGGSHYQMIRKHLGKHLTEKHRRRWAMLLIDTVDELHGPEDPEFRSALVAYIEWGTRIAVINSQNDEIEMNAEEPMPVWGWGEVKGPYMP